MIKRYTLVASLTAAIFSSVALAPASALEVAQAQQAPSEPGKTADTAITDQKIEAFAVAYLQVDKVRQAYSAKIEATTDAAAKEKLQTEASKEMVKAVEASPAMSVEEYSTILSAAQSDPAVAKKVQEKLQTSAPAQP